MDPRDFLVVAAEWAAGTREAEWRSAVSRAYYSVYHVGRELLIRAGFAIPDGPTGHSAVLLRLANAGQPDIREAGNTLRILRGFRNRADYDLDTPFLEAWAVEQTQQAHNLIRVLDELAATPTVLARVVAAIQVYERDILREVTYRSS
jgi:uncharacterized protein (UPF0332 family)